MVWAVPIILGGRFGEVLSAEVSTGNVPLLLSIPAMEALDMTIFMAKRFVQVGSLGVEVPMLVTRTKHRAVDITSDAAGWRDMDPNRTSEPTVQSQVEDLFIYLVEEASYKIGEGEHIHDSFAVQVSRKERPNIQFGARGILPKDAKREMTARRAGELKKSSRKILEQDLRTWVALRRDYTFGEEASTRQFTTTLGR